MSSKNIEDRLEKLIEAVNHESQFFEMPSVWSSIKYFFTESLRSIKFLLTEKENITFTVLQIILVIVSVCFGIQIISSSTSVLVERVVKNNIIFIVLLNAVLIVFIALISYPIGILTACMTSSYILYTKEKKSTIFACLKMVLSKSYNIWSLSKFDLMKNLSTKNQKKLDTEDDVLYVSSYESGEEIKNRKLRNLCWKIATVAIIPSLLFGRSKENSCYDAFYLLRYEFKPLSKLSVGYKSICLSTIFFTFIFLITLLFFVFEYIDVYFVKMNINTSLSCLFTFVVFPALMCFIIIWGIYRPLYIISATRIYLSYAKERNIEYVPSENSYKGAFVFICYLIFLVIVGSLAVYIWTNGTDNSSFVNYFLRHWF